MKKYLVITILFACFAHFGSAQNHEVRSQRIHTDPQKGKSIEFRSEKQFLSNPSLRLKSPGITPGVNWEVTDAAGIDYYAEVSSQSQKTVAGWGTNNDRLSLYGNSNIPIWEVPFTINENYVMVDMTEDGTRIANGGMGMNDQVEVYAPDSPVPLWSTTIFSRAIVGIQIRNDGQQVYVAAVNLTWDSLFVYCFIIGQNTPVWVTSYAGTYYTALVLSRSGNRLLLGQGSGGINKLFVLNTATGAQIFQKTGLQQQLPPAISDDGKYIVCGDVSGHVFLLEYIESTATYAGKWNYTVNGTNVWVAGMGISGDGSTIAIGTLIFTAAGGTDGELYVFNNYSPVPLWIYSNMGDMVQCVDLSSDGSIIAAAGWGPIDNSTPDLLLFRKQSNVPYLTVNSPGSNFCLDLSADGKLCVTGGKAVHARVMGNGGKLYNINSDPGGGTLSGLAVKSGSTQQAGAKIEIIGMDTYYSYTNDSSAYIIKYIPAGAYTVRYSAVGYFPQDITGIQIIDNQVTTKNVTLLPTGDPPFNLSATQGAGLSVGLTWQASPAPNITGYNIYRKQYSFDFYPGTPLGSIGSGQLTYSDSTALPLTHYYYVVTAQLPGNLQTPYSNEAIGWISTGFITDTISAYMGSTPTIDGIINTGEWSDAFQVDISNFLGRRDNIPRPIGSVMAYFKVNTAKTSLYVAINNDNDSVFEDHDEVALYVDDNNDRVFPPPGDDSEGNYWAAHYTSGDVIKYRPIYNNGGVGTTVYLPNPQIAVSNATGHIVYEFVIPLGTDSTWQIAFNNQDQSGLFVFVLDDPADYNGWWPCINQNIFTAEGYGVIVFGAIDLVPPPPLNLQLDNPVAQDIMLKWEQPPINDFDHFNIYWSTDGGTTFPKLDSTVGVQYFLTVPANGLYMFYVTTVDHAGHESVPSNIVQTNVAIGIPILNQGNDISMFKLGPNPITRYLNIDVRIANETFLTLQIFGINGKLVNSLYDSKIEAGLHHFTWYGEDLSGNDLQPGIYLVRYNTTHGNSKSFKIVIIR